MHSPSRTAQLFVAVEYEKRFPKSPILQIIVVDSSTGEELPKANLVVAPPSTKREVAKAAAYLRPPPSIPGGHGASSRHALAHVIDISALAERERQHKIKETSRALAFARSQSRLILGDRRLIFQDEITKINGWAIGATLNGYRAARDGTILTQSVLQTGAVTISLEPEF